MVRYRGVRERESNYHDVIVRSDEVAHVWLEVSPTGESAVNEGLHLHICICIYTKGPYAMKYDDVRARVRGRGDVQWCATMHAEICSHTVCCYSCVSQ